MISDYEAVERARRECSSGSSACARRACRSVRAFRFAGRGASCGAPSGVRGCV